MSDKPIVLEQVLQICGYDLQFKTKPNISNRQLIDFFDDSSKILRELDPEINDESIYTFRSKGSWFRLGLFTHYTRIEKFLNVKSGDTGDFFKDVLRNHSITYQLNPPPVSDEIKNSSNQYKHILMLRPNLVLESTQPNYKLPELMERLQKLPYLELSENLLEFNPKEIRAVLQGERPNKVLLDGKIIDLVKKYN